VGPIEVIPVVIDTNVLVSALLFGGTPGRLIPLWKAAKIQPHLTADIVDELLRVLAYPRLELTENEIQLLLYVEILPFCKIAASTSGSTIVVADPSEDIFLRCCEVAEAGALITGDNHLLALKSYRNCPMLSPSRFLAKFHTQLSS
jgi:putative PIN family toxin of toxin-antitoxin system